MTPAFGRFLETLGNAADIPNILVEGQQLLLIHPRQIGMQMSGMKALTIIAGGLLLALPPGSSYFLIILLAGFATKQKRASKQKNSTP